MSLYTISLLVFAIITEVAREILFKLAADDTVDKSATEKKGYFGQLFFAPRMWLGMILWAAEIIAWIMVLARAPLSVAFPLMSLCYCGTLIASRIFLGEHISRHKWIGVLAITIGVAIIGSTGI